MEKILDWVSLLRVRQWYKNLVVFLGIFFVREFFLIDKLYLVILGFIALCLVSSAGYLINDVIDLKKDRLHPEKKNRPLAAGRISVILALVLAVVMFFMGSYLAFSLNQIFFYFVLALFFLTQIYSLILKNIVIADILSIAVLFVIRAISGAYLIQVKVSPWLILCPFFLSLFMSIGKRHADLELLKENAGDARKVLKDYDLNLTNNLMIISTTLLIISYSLYSFLSEHENLLYTLPFGLYVIFRFFYLINKGSIIARHPEKVIKDKAMIIGILLWLIVTALVIYR